MKNKKIVHLTSVHQRFDTRIFYKQCCSLSQNRYEVSLVVADGKGNEMNRNVTIHDIGKSQGRLNRIFRTANKVYQKALALNADLYHLHDPELIPIGLKLKKQGKVVIFDAHEDTPLQLLSKPYLNTPLRYLLSKAFGTYERYAGKKMSAIVSATPFIRDKFLKINSKTVDVNNYPIINELAPETNWENKSNSICYIGGIEAARGIKEIVLALELHKSNARLKLAGSFRKKDTKDLVKGFKGWSFVDELGYLDRVGVNDTLNQSIGGLVTLHPIINYIDALPVKMFEYMSAGIPVIASNFPLWKSIIEGNNCGICVDPLDPKAIATAIDFFINNPDKAKEMGQNGRDAILNKYNWEIEEEKLLSLYSSLV